MSSLWPAGGGGGGGTVAARNVGGRAGDIRMHTSARANDPI